MSTATTQSTDKPATLDTSYPPVHEDEGTIRDTAVPYPTGDDPARVRIKDVEYDVKKEGRVGFFRRSVESGWTGASDTMGQAIEACLKLDEHPDGQEPTDVAETTSDDATQPKERQSKATGKTDKPRTPGENSAGQSSRAKTNKNSLQEHECCSIFPLMEDEDLNRLAEDIREHGQRDPIKLYQGKIIDGRNRYRACEICGIMPQTKECGDAEIGPSPLAYIVSANLHRCHLSESQRAMIGAELEQEFAKEAKQRQRRAKGRGKKVR
jgi:hypothetical protein